MTPAFRTAGKPALRKSSLALLLACTSALAGCATNTPPPEISYDNAAPAVQTVDPPSPVRIVELPRPLPLPGQMKPVDGARQPAEAADPAAAADDKVSRMSLDELLNDIHNM